MSVFIKLICVVSLFISINSHAEALADLEEFDLRTYRVENVGLKDLSFEMRSPELFEALESNQALGKLSDVYVKVYWVSPGRYKLNVEGLPKGFSDVEESIKANFKPFLEFVMPEKVASKFRSYKLTEKEENKNKIIIANDETGTKPVLKMEAVLDSKMRLKQIATESIQGKAQIDFEYSVKSWSQNKWAVDKAVTVTGNEASKLVTTQTVNYEQVGAFGFPKKVLVVNKAVAGNKQVGQEVKKTILFSNFETNSGKAQHMMTK